MIFRVTFEACVAGNPLKAWRDGTEPDDVWESQSHDFDDLDAAKAYIRALPEQTTTHVVMSTVDDGSDAVEIFVQDAEADHLDDAAPDVPMPFTVDSALPFADEEVPDAPPLVKSQEGTK